MKKIVLFFVFILPMLFQSVRAQPWQWAKAARLANASQTDLGQQKRRVATDLSGNVFILGQFTRSITFPSGTKLVSSGEGAYNAYIAKFDRNGNELWVRQIKSEYVSIGDITTDMSGNVILTCNSDRTVFFEDPATGGSTISGTRQASIIVKYTPVGTIDVLFNIYSPSRETVYRSVCTDGNGFLYVLEQVNKATIKVAVMREDRPGYILSEVTANAGTSLTGVDLVARNYNEIYIVGWKAGSAQFGTINYDRGANFLARIGFNSSVGLDWKWVNENSTGNPYGVTLTPDGAATLGFSGIARHTAAGTLIWQKPIYQSYFLSTSGGIVSDSKGNLYCSLAYAKGSTVDNVPLEGGQFNFAVTAFNGQGQLIWVSATKQVAEECCLVGNILADDISIGPDNTINVAGTITDKYYYFTNSNTITSIGTDNTALPAIFVAATKPTLVITKPELRKLVPARSTLPIEWTSQLRGNVHLEYQVNGGLWIAIGDVPATQGRYEWAVPDIETEDCTVRVASDISSATASTSIAIYKFKLLAPAAGELWTEGYRVGVTWNDAYRNATGTYKIEYHNGDGVWKTITSATTAGASSHFFTVPNQPLCFESNGARVRLSRNFAPYGTLISEQFTLQDDDCYKGFSTTTTSQENLTIYPNPAKGNTKIKSSLLKGVHIANIRIQSVIDGSTKQVGVVKVASEELSVDVSGLPAGLYTITIKTDKASVTQKFRKE